MSRKFSVGDRVRVLKFCARPELVGRITTIVEIVPPIESGHEYILDIAPRPGRSRVIARGDHIEPVYDGDEPASWSDCVWKPSEVRA